MRNNRKLQNRLRQAREDLGWTRAQMAEKMDMTTMSVTNWENGNRALTLEKLVRMSEVTGFTVQYLLGFDDVHADWTKPLSIETLTTMHRMPVWTVARGWALVNAATKQLVFADQTAIDIAVAQEAVYGFPPVLAYSLYGAGEPLRLHEVEQRSRVWVEPITLDADLSLELRGWYHLHANRLVHNEFGNRFYLDNYGAKWLAFDNCFGDAGDKYEEEEDDL
jgi:transcriptional regulator with XRE-family HTH domain